MQNKKRAKPLNEFRQPYRKVYILREEITGKKFGPMLQSFVSFASDKLGIETLPDIHSKDDDSLTFAHYSPTSPKIAIHTKNRHPMDIFRSVAHELTHHKQNEDGKLKDVAAEGETGSKIENEANAVAGKIMRWYAQANPEYFKLAHVTEEATLQEGIHDKARHKAVFVVGGPGSGKDHIVKHALSGHGLTEINPDHAFEHSMKKHRLDLKMPDHEHAKREEIRNRSGITTDNKTSLHLNNRNGVIINGTGSHLHKIHHLKNHLENMGYDTHMVFVHTSDQTSAQRNANRERSVPEGVRKDKYNAAQESKQHYKKLFGNNYSEINNDQDHSHPEHKKEVHHLFKKIKRFVDSTPNKPEANQWVAQQHTQRQMSESLDIKFDNFLNYEEKKKKKKKKLVKKESRADRFNWKMDDLNFIPPKNKMHEGFSAGNEHIKLHGDHDTKSWLDTNKTKYPQKVKPSEIGNDIDTPKKASKFHYQHSHEDMDKEFIPHQDKLNIHHKSAIYDYKNSSRDFNHYLRHNETSDKKMYNPEYEQQAEHLDYVTSHKTTKPLLLYKGFNPYKVGLKKGKMSKGTRFIDHGFGSASISPEVATSFARSSDEPLNGKHTIFKIHLPKGSNAHYIDNSDQEHGALTSEKEVVVGRNAHFQVTGHSQDRGYHYVHLKLLGHGKSVKPPINKDQKDFGFKEKTAPHIDLKDKYLETPKVQRQQQLNKQNSKAGDITENTSKPSQREFATTSLRKIYTKGTPGQNHKRKLKLKKLASESNLDKDANGIETILPVDSVGTTISGPKGTAYTQPFWESIQSWMENPETIAKFKAKYGEDGPDKLFEAAMKLQKTQISADIRPKTVSQLLRNFQKR